MIFFQHQISTPAWSPNVLKDCHAKHLPPNLRSSGGPPVKQQQAQPSAATQAVAKASLDSGGLAGQTGSISNMLCRDCREDACFTNILQDELKFVYLFALCLCISSLFTQTHIHPLFQTTCDFLRFFQSPVVEC